MPTRLKHRIDPQTTHPLIWLAAIICTVIAIAVIISGVVVFIGYEVIHPHIPFISVVYARLNIFDYDLAGTLQVQATIIIRAENDNLKAHSTFSKMHFLLSLDGMNIAELATSEFDVKKNDTLDMRYEVPSKLIPLDALRQEFVNVELRRREMSFMLKGGGTTRWKVGILGSFKFWFHLECELKFHIRNGTYIGQHCTSKAR